MFRKTGCEFNTNLFFFTHVSAKLGILTQPLPMGKFFFKDVNKLYSHLYSQKRRSTETQEALAELTDSDRKMSANLFTHNSSFQMDCFAIFHILSPAEYLTGKYFFLIVIGQLL